MKALKALVIFMAVLLAAGLGLLAYGLASKGQRVPPARHPADAAVAASSFGDVTVPLPTGARIEQMAVAGDRVVLRVTAAGGGERLVVLDPASGTVAGSFVLMPAGK